MKYYSMTWKWIRENLKKNRSGKHKQGSLLCNSKYLLQFEVQVSIGKKKKSVNNNWLPLFGLSIQIKK